MSDETRAVTDASKDLVYGHPGGGDLLFAVRGRALENVAFWQAKSWGEFRVGAPGLHELVAESARGADEEWEAPADDEPFDCSELGGTQDGDLPYFLQQEMLSFVPDSIQQKFGATNSTTLNGDYLIFALEEGQGEEDVIAAMEAAGFTCTQDERLVARAAGWHVDDDDVAVAPEGGHE